MLKIIFISFLSILFFGCSEQSNEKDELLSKIEELQKSNDTLQKKNDSLSTLIIPALEIEEDLEIREFSENVTIVNPPAPSPKNNNNSSEELIDSKTDDNFVNPFGGTSDNSFGTGDGQSDDGTYDGGGGSFGDPTRLNRPIPPDYGTDYSGNVCVELLIDDRGAAISAKSCNSTTHPEEAIIDSIVLYIAKHIRFKAEKGAPNRKAFYTVYVQAN